MSVHYALKPWRESTGWVSPSPEMANRKISTGSEWNPNHQAYISAPVWRSDKYRILNHSRCHEIVWGLVPPIYISGLDLSGQPYPWGSSPRYPLYTRLGGPLDITDKTKISCPCRDSNPDFLVVQPIDHMEAATFPPAVNLSTLFCNYTRTYVVHLYHSYLSVFLKVKDYFVFWSL
jgi:hypothetical protein